MDKPHYPTAGRPPKLKPDPRQVEMVQAYMQGQSYADIGRREGVSRQRVCQVVQRWYDHVSSTLTNER